MNKKLVAIFTFTFTSSHLVWIILACHFDVLYTYSCFLCEPLLSRMLRLDVASKIFIKAHAWVLHISGTDQKLHVLYVCNPHACRVNLNNNPCLVTPAQYHTSTTCMKHFDWVLAVVHVHISNTSTAIYHATTVTQHCNNNIPKTLSVQNIMILLHRELTTLSEVAAYAHTHNHSKY